MHSPTPWTLIVEDGGAVEIIQDADGNTVHYDTTYYPSGLTTDDAQHIVSCVNRVAELEAALRSVSAQCGNVIFNGEQVPASHERHMATWRSLKRHVDDKLEQ